MVRYIIIIIIISTLGLEVPINGDPPVSVRGNELAGGDVPLHRASAMFGHFAATLGHFLVNQNRQSELLILQRNAIEPLREKFAQVFSKSSQS
jgi:hypothetical protein